MRLQPMVCFGDKRRSLGIANDGPDLAAHELGGVRIGALVDGQIVERAQKVEAAELPALLELGLAFLRAHGERRHRVRRTSLPKPPFMTSTDDADPLAREVNRLVRPLRRVIDRAFEALHPFKWRHVRRGKGPLAITRKRADQPSPFSALINQRCEASSKRAPVTRVWSLMRSRRSRGLCLFHGYPSC